MTRTSGPGSSSGSTRPIRTRRKEEKITGRVICRVHGNEEGRPERVTALESPHELLSAAAMDAIQQWEWVPVEKEGHTVPFTVDVTVNFQLK